MRRQCGGQRARRFLHLWGSDPTGIQSGLLWPYTKALGLYHCPADRRIATAAPIAKYNNKPILRSISMNSYMGGRSFGTAQDWLVTSPNGGMDPLWPVYLKETEMKKPSETWLVLDEDQGVLDEESINDAMFLVNVGSQSFPDFPSRAHGFAYGINFNDGHAEIVKIIDTQGTGRRRALSQGSRIGRGSGIAPAIRSNYLKAQTHEDC